MDKEKQELEQAEETSQGFSPIETQEALDAILQKRLERQKSSFEKKLAEKDEEIAKLNEIAGQSGDAEKKLEELKAELEALQNTQTINELKAKIADEFGVPTTLIFGEDEEQMRQVAKDLKKFATPAPAPAVSDAGHFAQEDKKEDSRLTLAKQLLGE